MASLNLQIKNKSENTVFIKDMHNFLVSVWLLDIS